MFKLLARKSALVRSSHAVLNKGIGLFKHRLMGGRCLACLSVAQAHIALCVSCERNLALNHEACYQCAEPFSWAFSIGQATSAQTVSETVCVNSARSISSLLPICGQCQKDSPPFSRTYAPYLYAYPLDRLIHRFKDDGYLLYGQLLSQLLAERLRDNFSLLGFQRPDQVMSVPIHITRRFSRGFNPAALLADALAHQLSCYFNPKLCVKVKATEKQQGLSRTQRQHNLQHSFQLTESVQGQRIAVVDDVMTTGATARVIAQLLRDNGATEVYIWALARTPPPR